MKFIENKEAVSPVVGVMLMLVVTLIIAGVVSAFGGGLVSTTSATPQASISSSITYDDSLKLSHNGGESLSTKGIEIKTRVDSGKNIDMIFNTDLTNSTLVRTGDSLINASSFQTGDVVSVPWNDVLPKYVYKGKLQDRAYRGDIVTVTIYDKNSGKQIASATIPVN